MTSLAAALVALSAVLLPHAASAADGGIALVIAVENYRNYKPSQGSAKQGEAIVQSLEAQGFEVTSAINAADARARIALHEFSLKAKDAQSAIVVLIGHVATVQSNSFLLPLNAKLRRPTDLLSQGVSVASIVQIAGQAEQAAVFILMSAADIPSTLQGVAARAGRIDTSGNNIVVTFSSSDKVPLSRTDLIARQAAADLADALKETPMRLPSLVDAATAGGIGLVMGEVREIDLKPKPPIKAADARPKVNQAEIEARAKREAEKIFSQRAEAQMREAEERIRLAERRAAEAEAKAREESLRAEQAAADQAALTAALRAGQPQGPADGGAGGAAVASPRPDAQAGANQGSSPQSPEERLAGLQVIEALMGRAQRREIQVQLQRIGRYPGPLDGVFGPITRDGIRSFQTDLGDEPTGYLTPAQFQRLVNGPPVKPRSQAPTDAAPARASFPADASRWRIDGTIVRLVAQGDSRRFVYETERPGGAVVFDGLRDGDNYRGTAYANSSGRCAPMPYDVRGDIAPDQSRVTLRGRAPVVNDACDVVGQRASVLEFELLRANR